MRSSRNFRSFSTLMEGGFTRSLICAGLLLLPTLGFAQVEIKVDLAKEHLEKGDVRAAVIELKNALQEEPDSVDARLMLGNIYLRFGNGVAAEKEIRRVRGLGGIREQWLVPLARAYLLQGQFDRILTEIESTPELSRGVQADATALIGSAYMAKKDLAKAKAKFDEALAIDPDSVEALLGLSRLSVLGNDLDTADKLATRAVAKDSNRADAWVVRGEVNRRKADYRQAALSFDKALNLESGNIAALLGRATSYVSLNKPDVAEKDVDLVLKYRRNDPHAGFLKALIQFSRQEFGKTYESLLSVLRSSPNHMPAHLLMGTLQYQQDRLELAEEHLGRYNKAIPGNAQAIKLLAATRMKMRRPKKAIEVLEPLVRADTEDAQAKALLGSALLQTKDFERGTALLQEAVKLNPELAAMQAQLAVGQLASGNLDQATATLQEAVDLGQNLVQADMLLVMAHMQKKDYDKAIEAAKAFAARTTDTPMPQNLLGAAYLAKGDGDSARLAFEQALKLDPGFTPAVMNLGAMDIRDGKLEEAEQRYLAHLKEKPQAVQALLAMASLEESRGKLDAAMEWAQKAHDVDPKGVKAGLTLLGYVMAKRDIERASALARALSAQNPKDPAVLRAYGRVLSAQNRHSEAIDLYKRLSDLNPKAPEPYYLLAISQSAQKDDQLALSSLNKALRQNEKYLPAMILKAELQDRNNKPAMALDTAAKVVAAFPDAAVGYRMQGELLARRHKYDEALKAYGLAFERAQTADLVLRQFQILKRKDNKKSSLAILNAWLKKNPDDLRVRQVLAVAYHEFGDIKEAEAQYKKVLEKDENNLVVYNNMAWMFLERKDERALPYARKAYEKAPERAEVADTLGWALVNTGKSDEAVRILEKAVTQSPQRPDMRYHYAVALQKLGRPQDSRIQAERALSLKDEFPERKAVENLLTQLPK